MKKEDGFTIIEIVVVVAILTVSLLTIASTFVYNFKATVKNEKSAQALSFAKRISEDIKSVSIDMVNNEGYDRTNYSDETETGAFSPTHIRMRLNGYYSNFNDIIASLNSDDDGNSSDAFEKLADNLGINGANNIFIKKENMMAVVKIEEYKKRDSDGDLVKDSSGNEIEIKEIKTVSIEVKYLDRSNNMQQKQLSTLITRR
ncbi:prepilin-type N-terminal cleavage/methylation domain-containing protein [Halanaerobacter jeridensis]|uniref:Prepilin-type N-terminal cleavage/methylation domain-containing protein n=1 Tax=Halanaerobacter jeridensis TaxID=706427 RepID=A0A938XR00_9FIRM|nr:prepilin-type N-terminal cleavage/methylation domain-containing protein [Halanaerobacter jeridensis]MBM7557952.1 prepilin-type N-terminal cleavage/methylation domain-containing protein [Halanaerobacter jeridensis]